MKIQGGKETQNLKYKSESEWTGMRGKGEGRVEM
jgi:hypothetical protein